MIPMADMDEISPVRMGNVRNCMGCGDLGVNAPNSVVGYHCKVNMEGVNIRTKIIACGECPKGYYFKNSING